MGEVELIEKIVTKSFIGSNLVPSQSQQPVRSVGTEVLLGPHGAGYVIVTKSFIAV